LPSFWNRVGNTWVRDYTARLGEALAGDYAVDRVRQTKLRLTLIRVGAAEIGKHVAGAADDRFVVRHVLPRRSHSFLSEF